MRTRSMSSPINIWPGFVDALSALVLVMLFTFMVFIVAQFYLSDALNNREKSLTDLNQVIASLKKVLIAEKGQKTTLRQDRDTIKNENRRLLSLLEEQTQDLWTQKQAREAGEVDLARLKEQLEQVHLQLKELSLALQVSMEVGVEKDTEIQDLTAKLNKALQDKVKELSNYRSEFFGKLKKVLGGRDDIRVVGDRFIFQSEVLFPLGSDMIEESGQKELRKFAGALKEVARKIPPETPWILRVDGHTDILPMKGSTNRKLSMARALAVVNFLIAEGIPPKALVAAGFGEFHPLFSDQSPESLAKNRRIEFKLDQR